MPHIGGMLILVIGMSASAPVSAEDATVLYLEALRERGLVELAREFCTSRLASESLSDDLRGVLSAESSALIMAQAAETPDATAREALWGQAREVLETARDRMRDPMALRTIRFQIGLLAQSRAEWQRQLVELSGDDPAGNAEVRALSEAALKEIESLAVQIAAVERPMDRRTTADRALATSLSSLSQAVAGRLGKAQVAWASCHPDGSKKRQDAARSAIDILAPLASNPSTTDFHVDASVELARAHRLLGDHDRADEVLRQLAARSLAEPQVQEVLAERVEGLLQQDRTLDALEMLTDARKANPGNLPPRWEFLQLWILLKQANAMRNVPEKAGTLQASAFAQLRRLEREHAGVWAGRAERLIREYGAGLVNTNVTDLRRAAETLEKSGDHAASARVFQQAAHATQDPEEGYQLKLAAGAALAKAGSHGDAAGLYRELAIARVGHADAPGRHLQAILEARNAYIRSKTPADRALLETLLREHLERFPTSPSVNDARYLMGALHLSDRSFAEAIGAFQMIPMEHRLWPASVRESSRAYANWLKPLDDPTLDQPEALQEAIRFHESTLESASSHTLPEDVVGELTVRLSAFLIDPRIGRLPDAGRRLDEYLRQGNLPRPWDARARATYIVTLVQQDLYQMAERQAGLLADAPLESIVDCLNRLHQVGLRASEIEKRFLAQVRQRLTQILSERASEASGRTALEARLAAAVANLDAPTPEARQSASKELDALARELPKDPRVLEGRALAAMDARDYNTAADLWRQLASLAPETSPSWYQARLYLAMTLRRAGDRDQALKVISLVQVIHPDMGGPAWKPLFLEERRRLEDR